MIEVRTHSRFIYSLFAQDILACLVCSSLRNIYVMLYSPCESKYLSFKALFLTCLQNKYEDFGLIESDIFWNTVLCGIDALPSCLTLPHYY